MFLFLLLVLIVSAVFLIKRQYSYWETKNIPHLETNFPFGVMKPVVQRQRSIGLIVADIYKNSSEKILGLYYLFRPMLLIRDAHLARQILTSDFNNFHDRGSYVDEINDPLSANLVSLQGQSWRSLRAKLTPSFTSGKLKGMFETIDDVGNKLVKHLNQKLENCPNGKTFELKDVMTTYAVDIIGSVIFGLDVDSFANPGNEVRKLHTGFLEGYGVLERIYSATVFFCPTLAKLLVRLGFTDPTTQFMKSLMTQAIKQREEHKIVRKDLLQLLVQLRNSGKINSDDDDKIWNVETAAENLKSMSIEMIAANTALFYIAGSETTSATSSFTIYELSMYPELLKRAQNEVRDFLTKHGINPGDKFTYDALQDMKFLELCIMETTRKYPGLPFLNRVCTQDYAVPETKYVIKKDTAIIISLFGLHRDPEFFPDPTRYNPERFLDESKNYDPVAFMPFGEGPRQCIAQRMGKLNSKQAVAKVLANFDIKTSERKECEFEFNTAPVLVAKGGLNVHLIKKKGLNPFKN